MGILLTEWDMVIVCLAVAVLGVLSLTERNPFVRIAYLFIILLILGAALILLPT